MATVKLPTPSELDLGLRRSYSARSHARTHVPNFPGRVAEQTAISGFFLPALGLTMPQSLLQRADEVIQ
jgi:hypothetical protein